MLSIIMLHRCHHGPVRHKEQREREDHDRPAFLHAETLAMVTRCAYGSHRCSLHGDRARPHCPSGFRCHPSRLRDLSEHVGQIQKRSGVAHIDPAGFQADRDGARADAEGDEADEKEVLPDQTRCDPLPLPGHTYIEHEHQEKAEPAEEDQYLHPTGSVREGHATEDLVACIDPEDVGDLHKREAEGLGKGEGVLHLRTGRTDRDGLPGHHHTAAEKDSEDHEWQKQLEDPRHFRRPERCEAPTEPPLRAVLREHREVKEWRKCDVALMGEDHEEEVEAGAQVGTRAAALHVIEEAPEGQQRKQQGEGLEESEHLCDLVGREV